MKCEKEKHKEKGEIHKNDIKTNGTNGIKENISNGRNENYPEIKNCISKTFILNELFWV